MFAIGGSRQCPTGRNRVLPCMNRNLGRENYDSSAGLVEGMAFSHGGTAAPTE